MALASLAVNDDIAGRSYQERAIWAIAKRFETDQQRKTLWVPEPSRGG